MALKLLAGKGKSEGREHNCITLFIVVGRNYGNKNESATTENKNIFKTHNIVKTKCLGSGPLNVFTCPNIFLSDGLSCVIGTFRQARIGSIIYQRLGERLLLS